jgi:sulfoxide reductase heme-binding subunit YedZ
LKFLILTLAITPLRDIAGINWVRYRRALGLLAFYYAMMHFLAYMVLDKRLALGVIVEDVIKRWFITIGMAALVLLIPLALTSNAWSIRKMGMRWTWLHRLIYPIAAAGALHYCLSVKVIGPEEMIYSGLIALLIGWRLSAPALHGLEHEASVAISSAFRGRTRVFLSSTANRAGNTGRLDPLPSWSAPGRGWERHETG